MAGGMHGRGHAWQGACMAGGVHGRGACVVGGMHGRKNGNCSGQYESYWKAFLLENALVEEIGSCRIYTR